MDLNNAVLFATFGVTNLLSFSSRSLGFVYLKFSSFLTDYLRGAFFDIKFYFK